MRNSRRAVRRAAGLVAAGASTTLLIAAAAFAADAVRPTAADPVRPLAADSPFAVVAGTVIGTQEYDAALAVAMRQRFYHRAVPDAQRASLQREVGDGLIDRVLLARDARERGIAPDATKVKRTLDDYERRYGTSREWPRVKVEALPRLARELERQSIVEQLEAGARQVEAPTDLTLRKYYAEHRDLFTEPEQMKLAVILLKVDPSSPSASWTKARDEAAAIRARLVRGDDFGGLAALHSGDPSATTGGDMGYIHRGMLAEGLYDELAKLRPSTVSEPVRVLEGIALFRIDDRKPAKLRTFEEVKDRAAQLWLRQESDRRWAEYRARLRRDAEIRIVDASRYPPVDGTRPR